MKILDEYGIKQDPRLKTATKEMLITFGLCIIYSITTLAVAWNVGMATPPEQYSYILGFPTWFFLAIIVSPLAFFCVVIFLVLRVFKDVDLDPWLKKNKEEGESK